MSKSRARALISLLGKSMNCSAMATKHRRHRQQGEDRQRMQALTQ
jgi:hypothetical protein